MPKTAKIAISLPEDMLAAVERERRDSGESRSEFFRRAAEILLRRQREQEMNELYVRAYQQMPETAEEVEAARRAASNILAEEPWE
ncbi:MAG TPA: ribbon-helix-helix protein, CopG family [Dehalococcoidia bacterium]|nr:ribbon-helix-helix protein, CopG family [Dehalococcoidia bacterium]